MLARRTQATFALAALLAVAGSTTCEPSGGSGVGGSAATRTLSFVPTADLAKSNLMAVGDALDLFRNVDDGVMAADADDDGTYLRGRAGAPLASHAIGYSI